MFWLVKEWHKLGAHVQAHSEESKCTGKRGHIIADTNLSPFARARNICCRHKFCVRDTKMFLILFWNILCPQKCFPVCARKETSWATMCPQQCVLVCQYLNFVQKHFVSATNVSQFAKSKKHDEQQYVRNNVSSFASILTQCQKCLRV